MRRDKNSCIRCLGDAFLDTRLIGQLVAVQVADRYTLRCLAGGVVHRMGNRPVGTRPAHRFRCSPH